MHASKTGGFQIVAGWWSHQPERPAVGGVPTAHNYFFQATIICTQKKSPMMNNKYFRNLKKTGPPVETGWPLRLLDMRIFNCLCCADATAHNGKALKHYLSQQLPFFLVTHLINKHTLLAHSSPVNF